MMKSRYGRLLVLAVALLTLLGASVFLWTSEPGREWARALGDERSFLSILDRMGPWAPLVIVLAEMLQVLLAPIPGQVVGLVAGYLYGVVWGTLLCLVGLAFGSLMAIWLARKLGRPLVEKIAGGDLIARIDGHMERWGTWALFVIFLVPFLPDDSVCLVAGLTRVRLGELLLLVSIGRLPGLVVSTLIGAQAHDLTWPQLVVISAVGVLLALGFFLYRHQLEQWMFRLLDRFHRH